MSGAAVKTVGYQAVVETIPWECGYVPHDAVAVVLLHAGRKVGQLVWDSSQNGREEIAAARALLGRTTGSPRADEAIVTVWSDGPELAQRVGPVCARVLHLLGVETIGVLTVTAQRVLGQLNGERIDSARDPGAADELILGQVLAGNFVAPSREEAWARFDAHPDAVVPVLPRVVDRIRAARLWDEVIVQGTLDPAGLTAEQAGDLLVALSDAGMRDEYLAQLAPQVREVFGMPHLSEPLPQPQREAAVSRLGAVVVGVADAPGVDLLVTFAAMVQAFDPAQARTAEVLVRRALRINPGNNTADMVRRGLLVGAFKAS